MEGILVTTAAETQKTPVDNRLKGRPQHESDCTGKAGFRNRIPEGNHHTTLVRLFMLNARHVELSDHVTGNRKQLVTVVPLVAQLHRFFKDVHLSLSSPFRPRVLTVGEAVERRTRSRRLCFSTTDERNFILTRS
jgi:hypothetical protein